MRAESSKLYHVSIRPGTALGFPIPEAGSGMLRQKKQGLSLLHKLHEPQAIRRYKLHLRLERRAAMDDNFLPRILDRRALLPPTGRTGSRRKIWPGSSSMRWSEVGTTNEFLVLNRFGDAFIPYRAQPSLTCRCRMGDN